MQSPSVLSRRGAAWAAAALVLLWVGPGRADEPPSVKYLDTTIVEHNLDQMIVRGAFEVTSPPHRWYTVSYQLELDAATPLRRADGRPFWVDWSSVFTPEYPDAPAALRTTRWTDCRAAFLMKDIATAVNLPHGKRTVLWAVCYIFDNANKKYLGTGWGTPLIVTTDDAGRVIQTGTFHTSPQDFDPRGAGPEIPVRQVDLTLHHLRLKPGAKLYQGLEMRGPIHQMFVLGDRGASLKGTNRGYFFEAIDTPEKARELVEVAYPESAVVKSAGQYQDIVAALRAIKGWDPARFLPVAKPAAYGLTVAEEPGLGYRVTALMVDHERRTDGAYLRNVTLREFAIARDGRIGVAETVCVRGPVWNIGVPPMWEPEFPKFERVPGRVGPPPNLDAALQAHDAAVRQALQREGAQVIPLARKVTAIAATVRRPADVHNIDPFVDPKGR